MRLLIIFFIIIELAFAACESNQTNTFLDTDTARLLISPVYADTVFFIVNSVSGDSTSVKGLIDSFHNRQQINYETYFQRFVEKKNNFRIIHAVGTGLETVKENAVNLTRKYLFNDTISFDEAGIFEKDTTDPVSLIPLYPAHLVKKGEEWRPKAFVRVSMGEGMADYVFKVDSIFKDEHASVLALIKVRVSALLTPAEILKGGNVTVSGGGWFVWDCTVNQRRETHLSVMYDGKKGANEVQQLITVNDELKVYSGKQNF